MSDALGDPLRKPPADAPPSPDSEDDAVNLLDDSAEPTDDSPTVISRAIQPQGIVRAEDQGGGLRGRRLAHFELIEPIGVGGMAAVLRARDTQLDRLVALKILPPEMAADPENVRRFHQEARSAARLDHENIARVFFCGEDQRLHFIAFEFVEGDNLRTILEKRGRLPVAEALHYMLQVAAGLAHAARRGVVHRDIKPSNIIITPNGRAKLVDMGLARSLEPRHDGGLTQSGVTLGTFDYISPEQALEPRDADVRSDIYSLGCTFYHVLTGHAPVPEGTAAKKLHHHQHVKPPDPRQFVPELPDEVALILDRMMAKQPKDRYQTPEHLVHHLYLAARKLGAAVDVPEGVLAVEAALPTPPGNRPFVLAALAAIAVVGLIFLVDLSSSSNPQPEPSTRSEPNQTASRDDLPPTPPPIQPPANDKKQPRSTPTLNQARGTATFNKEKATVAELDSWLRAHTDANEIVLELDDLDFRERDDKSPDLVIANPIVTIRSRPGQRSTIRDQYRARLDPKFQASFIIRSKLCTIENLRFVLDQTGIAFPMAMLCFQGTRDARIHRCEFIQAYPWDGQAASGSEPSEALTRNGDKSRMASILDESSEPAALTLRESCFVGFASLGKRPDDGSTVFDGPARGGQDAVTRRGPVRIEASNCLFGPHAAVFRLEGNAPDNNGQVSLQHCSVLANAPSALFDVADGADARIDTSLSVVSSAGGSDDKGAVLLRRASERGSVSYQGRENRYYQLDNYFVVADVPEAPVPRRPDDLNKKKSSRELDVSPWQAAKPLELLKRLEYQKAFAVKTNLPELRVPSQDKELLGAERVLTFSYVDKLPALKENPTAPASRVLVVENRDTPDDKNLLYPSLPHALFAARPGDVIRLCFDDEVKLDPQVFSGPSRADVTLRADPRYHPVLTLSTETLDAALFAVYNGKLRLEGLEVRLPARREEAGWSAVVSFLGDGECVFKNCLITLDKASRKTALAVLPENRMRKASTQKPHLFLENCLVRGHGDLIWMQGGHAAEVRIDNGLLALSGSLLNVESDKETDRDREVPGTGDLDLRLRQVTTYLGENLIRLHAAKDIKGLPKTRCDAMDCLFLPAGERALIRLEGPEREQSSLRQKMSWEGNGKNAYGTFGVWLDQQSVDDTMRMPPPSTQELWKTSISNEKNSIYNVKLAESPADTPFPHLLPPAFQPEQNVKDCGADLEKLSALPMLKAQAEVSESEPDD